MRAVRLFRGRHRSLLGLVALVAAGTVASAGSAQAHSGDAHAQGAGLASLDRAVPASKQQGSQAELLAADKDLLVKVRLAGLWEMPAGEMAVEKGVNPRVKEIGEMIAAQHAQLDALVVNAANEVDVELPDEPNADQQQWLAEMEAASGREFDQVFVDRLRAAHGKVFPAIANVRAGTRNAVVRQLAQRANDFVLTHLTLLESTDLVDYESLPKPPAPEAAAASGKAAAAGDSGTDAAAAENAGATNPLAGAEARSQQGGVDLSVIWIILATSLIAGAIGTTRFVRPRWGGGRHTGPIPRSQRAYATGPIERPVAQRYQQYDEYTYPRPVPRSRP